MRLFRDMNRINTRLLVMLGFFIPISTAVTSFLLAGIGFFWLAAHGPDRFSHWRREVKTHPVAVMGLILFAFHLIGVAYSSAETERILESLSDGAKFLFIAAILTDFRNPDRRKAFMMSFVLAMLITLFLSGLMYADLLPAWVPVKGDVSDCAVFHDRIKQNLFMAFTAFVTAVWAKAAETLRLRWMWALVSLAAVFNVFFMVAGRTGHLVLMLLMAYYFFTWNSRKSLVTALAIVVCLGAVTWAQPRNPLVMRARAVMEEVGEWEPGRPAHPLSSSGLRLEFMVNSLRLVRDNPLLGTGTGGFGHAYANLVKDTGMTLSDNPHNDYLMTAVQFGLPGLAALLAFFGIQWRTAGNLDSRTQTLLGRGLVLTLVCAALVSSPLQDNAEGWFFAAMSACLFARPDPAGSESGPGPIRS